MDEVRCPYCVEGNGFKVMVPYGHRFLCMTCDHVANPSSSDAHFLHCDCLRCIECRIHSAA